MKQLISCFLGLSFLISSPAFSLLLLDQEMTPEEQKELGISKLTEAEQRKLEQWINDNLKKKSKPLTHPFGEELYVSEIINGGQRIRLSDNNLYELTPEDWIHAGAWIALARVQVTHSPNAYYPFIITNPNSGYSVRARLIGKDAADEQDLLKQEKTLEESVKENRANP